MGVKDFVRNFHFFILIFWRLPLLPFSITLILSFDREREQVVRVMLFLSVDCLPSERSQYVEYYPETAKSLSTWDHVCLVKACRLHYHCIHNISVFMLKFYSCFTSSFSKLQVLNNGYSIKQDALAFNKFWSDLRFKWKVQQVKLRKVNSWEG